MGSSTTARRVSEELPVRSTEMDKDSDRLDSLFERLYARLYGLTYRLLGDGAEAEDVIQEAFLKLSTAPVLDRPDEEVAAWMRRVCLNLGSNRIRSRTRLRARMERAARLEPAQEVGHVDEPAEEALRDEQRRSVRAVLARLPERQRDCLLLRHSGHTYKEIAKTLDVAVGSVGVILARGEQAFRRLHEEQNNE